MMGQNHYLHFLVVLPYFIVNREFTFLRCKTRPFILPVFKHLKNPYHE